MAEAGPSTIRANAMDVDQPHKADSSTISKAVARPPDEHTLDASVGYVFSNEMGQHYSTSDTDHPESPERTIAIYKALQSAHCLDRMQRLPIRAVEKHEALLVHNEDHWNKVNALQDITEQQVVDSEAYYEQLSLYVMVGTTRAARLSCGGVIEACMAVASPQSRLKRCIAIVRPPGHHAEPDEHMGFCFFNNVAVAARVVLQTTPIKRILILDWDVHHGNGTQRAFYDDPNVLYISIHRYEDGQFYPPGDFGSMESCGKDNGLGFSVNIPWPEAGMHDGDYLYAFQNIVMPIATEFAPELIIISAGFDAARGDELGECEVSPAGYAHMTHLLAGLAGGRLVVALEGGYCIKAISESALAVTQVLLGDAPGELPPLLASDVATETIWQVAQVQSRYWTNLAAHASEPRPTDTTLTSSLSEILKTHRQHDLYQTHGLMELPLLKDDLIQRFSSQITCTTDMLSNATLVVFVHEFGNLRAELQSSASCDLDIQRSYLLDASRAMVSWVKKSGYALLDVNLFAKPTTLKRLQRQTNYGRETMVYVWDNYISISEARRIVFIGHGLGCAPMINFLDLDERWATTEKRVKSIVQVVGIGDLPSTPRISAEFRAWYSENSLLIVPSDHYVCEPDDEHVRKPGTIMTIDGDMQAVELLIKAHLGIQEWVHTDLRRYAVRNGRTNVH
ncbi:histone deacetylase complex protein [Hymenopellis radicata]|nr:histone deacetylase complex protein [Hymenopellis radicata]